jgi:hypothetical protein
LIRNQEFNFSKSYLGDFFEIGWSDKGLKESDICNPQDKSKSEVLTKRLEVKWDEELKKKNPSLAWALAKTFIPEIYKPAIFMCTAEAMRYYSCFVLIWLIKSYREVQCFSR